MKRGIFAVMAAAAVCSLFLAACGKEEEETSRLIGTFTYLEEKYVNDRIVADPANEDNSLRIYATEKEAATYGDMYCTAYPFNTVSGNKVSYAVDQRLRLKRDFTYSYQYSITVSNAEPSGKEFLRVSVETEGTFSYQDLAPGFYSVALAAPSAGTKTVYGATVAYEGNIYAWAISSVPTYTQDLAYEISLWGENYEPDRYFAGRVVEVDKEEKSLSDDIYYADVLNDFAPYCDYSF